MHTDFTRPSEKNNRPTLVVRYAGYGFGPDPSEIGFRLRGLVSSAPQNAERYRDRPSKTPVAGVNQIQTNDNPTGPERTAKIMNARKPRPLANIFQDPFGWRITCIFCGYRTDPHSCMEDAGQDFSEHMVFGEDSTEAHYRYASGTGTRRRYLTQREAQLRKEARQ